MQRRYAMDGERDETRAFVMPWLDHGIHAVTCQPGTGIRVDGWSGGLLLVRADREGAAWMP